MVRKPGTSVFSGVAVVIWLLAVSSGVAALWSYSYRSSVQDTSVSVWPADTKLVHDTTRPALVVFVHPQCPCTRATLSQLQAVRQLSHVPFRLLVTVCQPQSGQPWRRTRLQQQAAQLHPDVLADDPGGREAQRFGADCSGTCLLFSANGRLLFRGGITESRGHAGACVGSQQLLASLNDSADGRQRAGVSENPVYGCSLVSSN